MRERLHHNQLLKRYMMKEGCTPQPERKKDKVTSFLPKLEDSECSRNDSFLSPFSLFLFSPVDEIELTDSLIVSAFGKPVPNLKPS